MRWPPGTPCAGQLTSGLPVVSVPTNQGCAMQMSPHARSCSQPCTASSCIHPPTSLISIPRLLLATTESGLLLWVTNVPLYNLEVPSTRKTTARSFGQAGCWLCSKRLGSSLHCCLIPQSCWLPKISPWASCRHLVTVKQPWRLARGLGALWGGSASQAFVSLWDGGAFAAGLACRVHCRLREAEVCAVPGMSCTSSYGNGG